MTGQLALTPEQIANQMALPEAEWLHVFDACKIIYPGKNHNAWWDLKQLQVQMVDASNTCILTRSVFGYSTALRLMRVSLPMP